MSNIKDTIEKARERGATDQVILDKIIENNPQKSNVFKEAKSRGATAGQILEEIIRQHSVNQEGKSKSRTKKRKASLKNKFKKFITTVKSGDFLEEYLIGNENSIIGIDISDYSIEVLLLGKDKNIISFGRSTIEEGVVENGEILNQKRLSEKLKETLRSTKPETLDVPEHTINKSKLKLQRQKSHKAIVSLPDSKTYVQVFEFENQQNLHNKISEKVKSTIPFDFDELYWDFSRLNSGSNKIKFLCVAAQRDIVDLYIYFFKSANINPVAFEIEGASTGRALLPIKKITKEKKKKEVETVMADNQSRMILDIGARTTVLSIFNKQADLSVSVSLPYAGYYFTKKIAEELSLSTDEAEKLKQKKGFKKDSETLEVLKPHGEKIVKEIERASRYFQREFNQNIKEVILAGGSSLLPEIDRFLSERIDKEVKIGNPLRRIESEGVIEGEGILYSNVVGLSLRSLADKPANAGINLLPDEVKGQADEKDNPRYKLAYAASIFFAIVGLTLFGVAIYYFVILPVPEYVDNNFTNVVERYREKRAESTVMIRTDVGEVSIYAEPAEESEIIGQAEVGVSYEIIQKSDGWVRIENKGKESWIKAENLEGEPLEGGNSEAELKEVSLVRITSEEGVELKAEPNLESESITVIENPTGNVYEILNEEDEWVMIIVGDNQGWISKEYIETFEQEIKEEESIEDIIQSLTE